MTCSLYIQYLFVSTNMNKKLEKIFHSNETGARIMQLNSTLYAVYDSPVWNDNMARMITNTIPNVQFLIKSNSDSLSGFEIQISIPAFYHRFIWLILVIALFVVLAYFVNECWIPYLSNTS